MEEIALISFADEQLRLKGMNRKEIAELAGVARNNYYYSLRTGSMTVKRFLAIVKATDKTLAEFSALYENRELCEGSALEMHFKNEKLQLEIDYLKRLLKACEDGKNGNK